MRSSFLSWSSPAVRYLTAGVSVGSAVLLILLRAPAMPSPPGAGPSGLPGSTTAGPVPCVDVAMSAAPIGDLAARAAPSADAGVDPLVGSLLSAADPGPADDGAVTPVVRDLEAAASRCEVPP